MDEEKPVRVGDREREDAVVRLGAHFEAGRLTAEEHQERVGEALQAKTQVELAALFADLPGESSAGVQQEASDGEQWAGPWGWSRPPWTAPQGRGASQYRRVPLLLLVVLGALASVACVVLGGHPPVLPLLLLVVGVVIAKKRRQERRA
jgi:uncharacterized protein DUF1707